MKLTALTVTLSLVAGQVSALSCMRPDPQASFQRAADSTDVYYVLYGTLDFDASLLPGSAGDSNRKPAVPIPAQFEGHSLSDAGFANYYAGEMTLLPTCAGPWCGSHVPDVASLMFARVVDGAITIEAAPCGGFIFTEPKQEVLDSMTACMNGNCG